jgi:hypothetical protein
MQISTRFFSHFFRIYFEVASSLSHCKKEPAGEDGSSDVDTDLPSYPQRLSSPPSRLSRGVPYSSRA